LDIGAVIESSASICGSCGFCIERLRDSPVRVMATSGLPETDETPICLLHEQKNDEQTLGGHTDVEQNDISAVLQARLCLRI